MAVDEAARHRLHTKLEEILGPDPAAILMTHLPPAGGGDVATKRDLDSMADQLRTEMERLGRRLVMWVSSMVVAAAGLAFAAGRFG
jgi:hypothetical protein